MIPAFDLAEEFKEACDQRRDPQSRRLSEIAEEHATTDVINAMCAALDLAPPPATAWVDDDAVQSWLRDNRQDYIMYCLEQAGVRTDGTLWMEAAGTLRLLGKI